MRTYDSPSSSSHVKSSLKYKNHQSPITKLTNLTDVRVSEHANRGDNALNDRSNQPFLPQNASKYVPVSYQKPNSRQKQIQDIRKKYYQNSDQKNRSVTQKYDRYQIYRAKNTPLQKRLEQKQNQQKYEARGKQATKTAYHQVQNTKSSNDKFTPSTNYLHKQNAITAKGTSHLQKISEVSNSNYQTISKGIESFSPERHRIKSSYIIEDRSSKRKHDEDYYRMQIPKNKQNQKAVIKQTKSRYQESVQNSGGNKSSNFSNRQRDSSKSTRLESRVQSFSLKPFTIEESYKNSQKIPSSTSYQTIYDNYLPKTYNNPPVHSTLNKPKQDESGSKSYHRNYTDEKKQQNTTQKNIQARLYQQRTNARKKLLQFQDTDRIKQIQKRLKQRELQFKKKQQDLEIKFNKQSSARPESNLQKPIENTHESALYTRNRKDQNQTKGQYEASYMSKQIQKLSSKIKQFQDKKKELNISTGISIRLPQKQKYAAQKFTQGSTHIYSKQYQDARKTLQGFRQNIRPKSSIQPKQVGYERGNFKKDTKNQLPNQEDRFAYYNDGIIQKQVTKRCDFIQKTKPLYSQKTLPYPKRAQNSSFAFQLYRIQSQNEQSSSNISKVTTTSNASKSNTNASQCKNKFQIQKRTDDGIEQRKKRLQDNKPQSTQSLKRLVTLMSQQSALDEEFRNCKIWFHTLRDQNRWKQLKRALRENKAADNQYKELNDGTVFQFQISEEQNNPFFSVNHQSKFNYQTLVNTFLKSKTFWQDNFSKKFDRNSLKSEGFCLQKFDLQKKGFINLQDLVRFLNFESGNFYRNRDLYLIYKRFACQNSRQNSLKIDRMLSALTF